MLKRIRIRGYKSLHDINVGLQELAVLIGPNASGKSNLLEAMQLLSRLASGEPLEGAFGPPHRGEPIESFSVPEGGIGELRARKRLTFSIEADIRLSDARVESVNRGFHATFDGARKNGKDVPRVRERDMRYRIVVEMLPESGDLMIADERLTALSSGGKPARNRKPFIERQGNNICIRPEGRGQPVHAVQRSDRSALSSRFHPPHHPHPEAIRSELRSWLFFHFDPTGHMRDPNPIIAKRHIGRKGEALAAVIRTLKALEPERYDSVNRAMRLMLPEVDAVDADVSRHGAVELRVKENGHTATAGMLSDGTLRMLGLLALVGKGESPSLIGLEEPENGIHPGIMDLVASVLRSRTYSSETQYVVTTHSPLLTDLLPPKSLLITRKIAGKTRIDRLTHWGPLVKIARIGESFEAIKDDFRERVVPVSERVLQGDFDA